MSPSLFLGLKQFWANKSQSLIIILLVLFSSLLLATGFGLLFNQTQLIKELPLKNTPELHLVFSERNYQVDELASWWQKEKVIKEVEISPILTNGEVSINNLSAPIELSLIAKQGASQVPLPGQVWVPTNLATAENIQLGDYLVTTVNQQKLLLEVSGIIVDPFYTEAPLDFKRIWLNQVDFETFLLPQKKSDYTLSIQFNQFTDDYQKIWQKFSDSLPSPFIGKQVNFATIANNYQAQFTLIAKILLLAGLSGMLITSYLIYFMISYTLLSKDKQFGIYRIIGFSTRQLRLIFLSQFSCAAIIGMLLGLSLSTISLSKICLYLLKNLILVEINLTFTLAFCLSLSLVLLVISLSVLLATRKIKALSPSHVLAQLWKTIPAYRQSSWALVLSLTLAAFIFCLSLNLTHSFNKLGENPGVWGYNEGDLLLKLNQPDQPEKVNQILAYLRKDPSINSIVAINFYPKIVLEASPEDVSDVRAMGFFGNLEKIGQTNLVGRHPLDESEISLGQTTAKKLNKGLGDTLVLSINDQTSTFTITGIFQSLTNGGEGVRLVDQNILDADPYFSRSDYYLKTTTKELATVIKKIEHNFPKQVSLLKLSELVQEDVAPLTTKVKLVLGFASVIAFALIVVSVFTSLTLTIEKDRAQLSLLKMIGVSHWELLKTQLIKLFILTTIGSVLGITLALIFSTPLLSYFFTKIGLSQFPLTISLSKTCLIIPLCCFSVLLGAALPLSKIKKNNLREIIKQ